MVSWWHQGRELQKSPGMWTPLFEGSLSRQGLETEREGRDFLAHAGELEVTIKQLW